MSSAHATGRTSPARNRPARLGRGVRTQRASVLAERAQRRDQASADLWLAVTAANPGYLRDGVRPGVDAVATAGVLAVVSVWARATGHGHTLAWGIAVVGVIAYATIIVKALRWRARTRAARCEFAALPVDRQATALTEYEELRHTSPALFPRRVPARLVRTA